MSQFNFISDRNNILNLDGELKNNTKPRWQKKMENSINSTANISKQLSCSYNNSLVAFGPNTTGTSSKTPNKSMKKSPSRKSPGEQTILFKIFCTKEKKFLEFSLGRKTPTNGMNGGSGSKTPSGGDRFIPNRGAMDFELGNYLVRKKLQHFHEEFSVKLSILQIKKDQSKKEPSSSQSEGESSSQPKPSTPDEKVKALSEAINGMDISNKRILSYREKAPAPPETHLNPLRVVYSVKTPMSTKSGSRFIPT